MGLWDNQNSAMAAVSRFFHSSLEKLKKGETASGAIVMPTGAGKTVVAAEIARSLGLRALILAPTIDIVLQHYRELQENVPEVRSSIFYSEEKDLSGKILVATYDSALALFKSGDLPKDIAIVFYDEAHTSISPQRSKLHGQIGIIDLGLTATPAYSPERHIWNTFDEVIYEMPIQEGIESEILCPLRGYVIETDVDVSGVRLKVGGIYLDEAKAEKYLNVIARNKAARDFYLDGFKDVPAVAFCLTRHHAEEFASYLRASDVRATFIHGGLTPKQRKRRLAAFEDGSIDVITSRDVLIQGWDSQRAIMELNLRPTYSRVVKTHMVGRVIRARLDKEAGVVVEFQDKYAKGQQPILVHHLFDQLEYRQGGLVAAPRKKKEAEEEKLRKKQEVTVVGDLKVSYGVRKTVDYPVEKVPLLEEEPFDFTDKKMLREILSTCSDLDVDDPACLSWNRFASAHFYHPRFAGSGSTLLHKAFGIRHTQDSRLSAEDYENFLYYVFEDKLCTDGMPGEYHDPDSLESGNNPFADMVRKELGDTVRRMLRTLPLRQEKILRMRFAIDEKYEHTLAEIAARYGVWGEAIRSQESKALSELRSPRKGNLLRPFWSEKSIPKAEISLLLQDAMDVTLPTYVRSSIAEFMLDRYQLTFHFRFVWVRLALERSLFDVVRAKAGLRVEEELDCESYYHADELKNYLENLAAVAKHYAFPKQLRDVLHRRIALTYLQHPRFSTTGFYLMLSKSAQDAIREFQLEVGMKLIKSHEPWELDELLRNRYIPDQLRVAMGMELLLRGWKYHMFDEDSLGELSERSGIRLSVWRKAQDKLKEP